MSKLDEMLNYLQNTFSINYYKESRIKDDVCYLIVGLEIPYANYIKKLKVFSYITEKYQELNNEKMYKKVCELFPSDNPLFEKQLDTLASVTRIKGDIFKSTKDIDNDETLKECDIVLRLINTVNTNNNIPARNLSELVNLFNKVK